MVSMFKNYYKGKKVLVTGNTGFKGSWLSIWLEMLGANVIGISNEVPTTPALFEVANLKKESTSYFEDIRNLNSLTELIKEIEPDIIFHLAAQPIVKLSYDDPIETFSTNVMGTANVLQATQSLTNNCTVIMITSDKCYDNVEWEWGYREEDRLGGKDPYSASKAAAEIVISSFFESFVKNKRENIKICSVRAGNVIGGGDWAANRLIPDIYRAWSNSEGVHIRSPYSTRPWQHVLEPLSGYLSLAQHLDKNDHLNGMAFNFGPNANQNQSVLNVLNELEKHWDKQQDGELFTTQTDASFHEAGLLKLNCDRALQYLSWKPNLEFSETLALTSKWYNEFYNGSGTNLMEFTKKQINFFCEEAVKKSLEWTK
jgi:CDP-glucose 4,6-dehydratase